MSLVLNYSIISIGTLSHNPFWGERQAVRTPHATTTLIRSGETTILVDPGLPEQLLAHLLRERAGIGFEQIGVVFLTTFLPSHRRALPALEKADWLMHGMEIEAAGEQLEELSRRAREDESVQADGDLLRQVRHERAVLDRFQAAPEKLTPQVHLFPLPGPTPGSCGLLLAAPTRTIVLAADAVPTRDHFEAGRVWEHAASVDAAQRSLQDVIEVADEIVPGHDNLFVVSGR